MLKKNPNQKAPAGKKNSKDIKLSPPSQVTKDINDIIRRLRTLEERYANLRKKSQLTDQNMLEDSKRILDEIKLMETSLSDLRKEISEVNAKIRLLNEEIGQTVPKRELALLSKYLDYWEPIKFVKKDEVYAIVKEVIEEIVNKPKAI